MSLRYSVLLMALLALGFSTVASAEDPNTSPSVDPSAVAAVADLSLDSAFEQATSPKNAGSMAALNGPTSMDCRSGEATERLETCVVTVDGLLASTPAALATH
jgi:hypothetical protein